MASDSETDWEMESEHGADSDWMPSDDESATDASARLQLAGGTGRGRPQMTAAEANRRMHQRARPAAAAAASSAGSSGGGSGSSSTSTNGAAAFPGLSLEELEAEIQQGLTTMATLRSLNVPQDNEAYVAVDERLRSLLRAKQDLLDEAPEERGHQAELAWDVNAPARTRRVTRAMRTELMRQTVGTAEPARRGSARAAGQVAIEVREPRPGGAPRRPRPEPDHEVGAVLYKKLTPELYTAILSAEPVWELANKYKARDPYTDPGPTQPALRRPVSGNVSRFRRGDPMQAMCAHIAMEICTGLTKMPQLGLDQGQGVNGGPYHSCGKTCVAPPADYDMHAEVTIKGFTQISKASELAAQGWFDWFVSGLLPTVWLRLKGGGVTGTTDASKSIYELNEWVGEIFQRLLTENPGYGENGITADRMDELMMKPRCASRSETLDFIGNGSYRLAYPQQFVACANVTQLGPLAFGATTAAQRTRFAQAGQPDMPWAYIMAGCVKEGENSSANPYLPVVWDHTRLGKPASELTGRDRPLPALSANCDEDELNRSSTGNEQKEKLLFLKAQGGTAMLNRLIWRSCEDPEDDAVSEAERAAAEHREEQQFSVVLHGLRAMFGKITKYTATPTDSVYDLVDGSSQIAPHMVEMTPSNRYIGYDRPRIRELAPWCQRFIEVVELPDRAQAVKLSLSAIYPKQITDLTGIEVDPQTLDGLPDVFQVQERNGNKVISIRRNQRDVVIAHNDELGVDITAGDVRDAVGKAQKTCSKPGKVAFWYADGNNITALLKDAQNNRDAYPEGYRNMLMLSNYTRTGEQKSNWVSTILGFSRAERGDRDYDPRDLVEDLITVEWTDKYVRFSWVRGAGIDEGCLRAAFEWLGHTGGDTCDPTAKANAMEFARAARWSIDEADDDDEDDEGVDDGAGLCVMSPVSNINYAYSVLWKYKELNEARAQAEGVEGVFLKILLIAGEICGRSVRCKSHDKHKFVLNDMLFSFNANTRNAVTLHIIAALQAVGRLCTIVPDAAAAPPIKLWTPESNWAFLSHWMDVIDELVPLHQLRAEGETLEQALNRVVADATIPGFEALRRHFCAPTGHGKNGAAHNGRLDHRLKHAKRKFEESNAVTEELGTTPDGVDIPDRSEEITAMQVEAAVGIASQKTLDALAADTDDEDSEAEGDIQAAMGAPTLQGYESVPVPQRIKVCLVAPGKRARVNGRRTGRRNDPDADYGFTVTDDTVAFEAVGEIRALHRRIQAAGWSLEELPDHIAIQLWVAWYCYLLHINYGARGPTARGGRHGVPSQRSRLDYSRGVKLLVSALGQSVFQRFADLPQDNSQYDRDRVKALCEGYGDAAGLSREPTRGRTQRSAWQAQVTNMLSYLNKWTMLFPPTANLKAWLYSTPAPAQQRLPSARARSPAGAPAAAGGAVQEIDEDSD